MMQSFETDRLLMRPLCIVDEAFYCACYTDPMLMQHIGAPLKPEVALRSFTAALKLDSSVHSCRRTWIMQDKNTHASIGLIALIVDKPEIEPSIAEIGAIISSDFHNMGYSADAIGALVGVAFKLTNLSALYTRHGKQHLAASGLMRKLGFEYSETDSNIQWLLNRADWQESQALPI